VKRLWFIAILWLSLATATPVMAADMITTPSSVSPGGSVTVSGTVPIPGCPPGGRVLVVDPFRTGSLIATTYDSTGRFSVRLSVPSQAAPGSYVVGARCVGRNEPGEGAELGGPFPAVTVVGLPRTGGSIGPFTDRGAAALALLLVAGGSTAVYSARRRRATIAG
jgi:hypothetical protein